MPANLTPQYKKAEEAFRRAETVEEKIACLEQMLAVIPKHKGTDHLQADLKGRLAKFREEQRSGKKKAGRRIDPFAVPRSGAGQVVLLGLPNSGKSSVVAALTNARVVVAEYPFSTTAAVPGIARHEDVPIQLVDMPPITADGFVPGAAGTYRLGDIILVVVDLSADPLEQYETCRQVLIGRGMWPARGAHEEPPPTGEQPKPTVVALNKIDLPGADETFAVFSELYREQVNLVAVSAVDGRGLKDLMARCYGLLGVLRVYAKPLNREPDLSEPFVVPIGSTIADVARVVHRDLPEKVRFAKVWGANVFPGQQVMRDYVLADKDIIELHV